MLYDLGLVGVHIIKFMFNGYVTSIRGTLWTWAALNRPSETHSCNKTIIMRLKMYAVWCENFCLTMFLVHAIHRKKKTEHFGVMFCPTISLASMNWYPEKLFYVEAKILFSWVSKPKPSYLILCSKFNTSVFLFIFGSAEKE